MSEPTGLRQPKRASEAVYKKLGVKQLPDSEKVEAAIKHLDEFRHKLRSFTMAMETCVKCGACAENCHTYLGTRDPNNIPAGRVDLVRKIYKRYFTVQGRLFPGMVGAQELDLETLEKWFAYFYQCSECRRCARVCPFGIDTAEVTMVMRQILFWLGIAPQHHVATSDAILRTGNHMGLTKAGIVDTCEFLAEEIAEENNGLEVDFPMDKPDCDILYIPSSADFMVNVNTAKGAAMFFKYIGANYTMSSKVAEAGNFGYLMDHERVMRFMINNLMEEADRLGVKKIVWGECGHGWRTGKMYVESMSHHPASRRIPIVHIHDVVEAYIKAGKLELDPSRNEGRTYTLHDPCNYFRACNYTENTRTILNAVVPNGAYIEMTPNRADTFCCGGGSGILFDNPEMLEYRILASTKKAEQVRATGAEVLVAPCAICKAQLNPMAKAHNLGVEVAGLMDLVGPALIFRD